MASQTEKVGLRELRHAPLPGHSSALERLAATGRIIPARLDLAKLGPPPDKLHEMSISEALAELRNGRVAER